MNTNVVIPSFDTRQPSWVQPTISQPSRGYTYPVNQPLVVNKNYQLATSRVIYTIIPYLGNMYTPWGQPYLSNVPAPGGTPGNIVGGYVGPTYGLPPLGGPPWEDHHWKAHLQDVYHI